MVYRPAKGDRPRLSMKANLRPLPDDWVYPDYSDVRWYWFPMLGKDDEDHGPLEVDPAESPLVVGRQLLTTKELRKVLQCASTTLKYWVSQGYVDFLEVYPPWGNTKQRLWPWDTFVGRAIPPLYQDMSLRAVCGRYGWDYDETVKLCHESEAYLQQLTE